MSLLEDVRLESATVLFGENGGKYPDANCVLVEGTEERILLDTTPGLAARGREAVGRVDRILLTHCHEDHLAANFLFPDAEVRCHSADLPGLHSLDGFLAIFGPSDDGRELLTKKLLETFHYEARPDALPFEDGDVFDIGGSTTITVVHAPGHTRGHCAFHIQPDDLLFLGDVDLSSFGPFYADAWGSLDEFEDTLAKLRPIEARYYLSGHHIGLLEGREAFLARLDRYEAKLQDREARLLEFLAEPRSLEDIVAHRFVYRPQDTLPGVDLAERRSMSQHIERLTRSGQVLEVDTGRFRTT